jgi:membrane protein DedA with SNARE-associated domain
MPIEQLISRFGYPALVLGLLLEGETVLVLAAFIAHRGHLSLPLVISTAFLVTFASDQFFFWVGRTRGQQFLARRPGWKPSVEKARSLIHDNTTLLFIGFRFMYGLRTVLPFVFGMSRFDPKRFAFLNAVGVLLWALFFGIAGYLFGQLMQLILKDVSRYEIWIVIFLLIPGTLFWLHQRYTNRKRDDPTRE